MTRRDNDEVEGIPGEVVDEGTTGELLQDKLTAYSVLRADTDDNKQNPNDQPGFDDGLLGGHDFEDREGVPNSVGGSDLGGDERGGEGTERSGGVDGGPARKTPLPGTDR